MTTFEALDRPLTGDLSVPGDKSISHRALILGALASGRSRVLHPNTGTDLTSLGGCLGALGATVAWDRENDTVEVEGYGFERLTEPDQILDCGNSGTSLRTLTGVCSGIPGMAVLTGDESVRRRPMLRVVTPLRRMGARIDGRDGGAMAPIVTHGGGLHGIAYRSPVASAQVKTAILLAGLAAEGPTTVTEPAPSRDHTERMLAARGVPVATSDTSVTITGGGSIAPLDQRVPGDISSAMFLVVAALLVPGSDITVTGVGLNPTRTVALEVLRSMGGRLEAHIESLEGGEPIGSIAVRCSELHGVEVPPGDIPGLIDEIPALVVAAAAAEGETVISGAAELRVKESDRIAGLVGLLRTLGVDVEERPDGMMVSGRGRLGGGRVDARGDHRIAMAAAVAGLVAGGPVRVDDWGAVATSFPEFVDILKSAGR